MTLSLSSDMNSKFYYLYSDPDPNHDEIAQGACEIWTMAGQPEGRNDEFWFEAEKSIISNRQSHNVSDFIVETLTRPVSRQKRKA